MNLRAILKTIAFIFGLYFVLEYLLPEKVGGDFDNYEVLAPAHISTPEGSRLFYTGLYRKHLSAIGRLVEDPADVKQHQIGEVGSAGEPAGFALVGETDLAVAVGTGLPAGVAADALADLLFEAVPALLR